MILFGPRSRGVLFVWRAVSLIDGFQFFGKNREMTIVRYYGGRWVLWKYDKKLILPYIIKCRCGLLNWNQGSTIKFFS